VSESNGDGLSYDGCGLKKGGDITHRVKREGDRERVQKNAERQYGLRWRLTD